MSRESVAVDSLDTKEARSRLASLYGKKGVEAARLRYRELALPLLGEHPGAEPRFYAAPGRTELGGNHTDHNHGRVLCAAVDLDVVACALPQPGDTVRIRSAGWEEHIVVDLADLEPREAERGKPAALLRGVARGLADRGIKAPGATVRVHSEVLVGSGLSSSAAFEVLLAVMLADLAGRSLPALEIARIGQFAENRYFGKPCGLMDQAASALGGIAAIDFGKPEEPLARRVAFDFAKEGYALAVVNTGGNHADLTGDYAAIPAEMRAVASLLGADSLREVDPALILSRGPEIRKASGDRAFLRAFHFIGENDTARAMAEALEAGKLRRYLRLVRKSGDSSWRFLQNLYPPGEPREQGLCVALALSELYLGKTGASRVHGGGFAGTIQACLPRKALPGYVSLMESHFGPGSVIVLSVRREGAGRVF